MTRDRIKKDLKFNQHLYVRTTTERFKIDKTAMVPAGAGEKPVSKKNGPKPSEKREEIAKTPYAEALGMLMWASTMTRSDISKAVRTMAKLCEDHGMSHWKAVVKIPQFVRRTPEKRQLAVVVGTARY